MSTIRVRPNEAGDWSFACYSRFEGLLMGGLHRDGEATKLTTYAWPTDSSFFNPLFDHATGEERAASHLWRLGCWGRFHSLLRNGPPYPQRSSPPGEAVALLWFM